MKIYISGKITDNPTYVSDFKKAEDTIRSLGNYVQPVNPVALEDPTDDRWSQEAWFQFMNRDMRLVADCDAIVLLKGKTVNWKKSPGAWIEYWTAKKFHKKIFYGLNDFISWYNKETKYGIEHSSLRAEFNGGKNE